MSKLNKQEEMFCNLFVNGTAPYAGNSTKCYSEVFGEKGPLTKSKAKELLSREYIQEHIAKLEEVTLDEAKAIKRYLTENLMSIIDETANASFTDRFGTKLSPAPMRSVAVQASKALMELYPVKETQKISLEAEDGGGIVFNVVVPDKPKDSENE